MTQRIQLGGDLPDNSTSTSLDRFHLEQHKDLVSLLKDVHVNERILQEWTPVTDCLEWELSRLYWETEGVLPFVENDVPFIVNNSGTLSEKMAVLFYTYCKEVKPQGRIQILELGAGTGLHALYFLNTFQRICKQEQADYYHRLTYYVSDGSSRSVFQWRERKQFEAHAGVVVAGVVDALNPAVLTTVAGEAQPLGSLQAVFCNYLLDVLPATLLHFNKGVAEKLYVRSHLPADDYQIKQYTDMTLAQIQACVASDDPLVKKKLLPLLPIIELETRYHSSDEAIPYLEQALEFAGDLDRVLHNYGAINCLQRCGQTLADNGIVMINDYGPTQREDIARHTSVQRFGSSSAQGINFPFIEFMSRELGFFVEAPQEDDARSIHTRLLRKTPLPQTSAALENRFGSQADAYFEEPLTRARAHASAGRKNEALSSYRDVLGRYTGDWFVLAETAEFLSGQLHEYEAALAIAREALALNPWYSVWLWNVMGDCLFGLERFNEAHEAYLQAHSLHADDVRTNLNLAYTYYQNGRFDDALQAVTTALAMDRAGHYRDKLLEKQQQVLSAITTKWICEQERLLQRAERLG